MTSKLKISLIAPLAVLALLFACSLAVPQSAFAATDAELQEAIETSAQAFNAATTQIESLEAQIAENNVKIDTLTNDIPKQEDKCKAAVKTLYLLSSNRSSLLYLVLESDSFNDFITTLEYLDRVQQSSLDVVLQTRAQKYELELTQAALNEELKQVEEEKARASQALAEAQTARSLAQQAALEAARAGGEDGSGGDLPATSIEDVNWSTSKADFVNEWAARIDNYLAGSPLAGQGTTFAAAAWDYGVDPRWSPAISNTESSKGLYCFRTYNAWGWGQKNYSSWEESINVHVSGLARGYGYTISYAAAQKYCPPNYDYWYHATYDQMQLI